MKKIFGLIFLVAALLFVPSTHAQVLVRGGAGNALTYTTADINLFVDPTGSDSGSCTSTGTGACLTIQGALNKIPKGLRHRATVTVAAGNYAGFTVSGFTIDPAFQRATAGLLITGTLGNVTPATGSATGTATAGSAGSNTTFGTLTDAAATWTVNDPALVGKLLVITGGTGAGQVKVIVSNTATALTIAGTWTAPTGTSTYAIQAPTSVITSVAAAIPNAVGGSAVATAGFQIVDNVVSGSLNTWVDIMNMGFSLGSSVAGRVQGTGAVGISQSVFASSGIVTANGATLTATAVGYVSTAACFSLGSGSAGTGAGSNIANSYLKSSQTSVVNASLLGRAQISGSQIVLASTATQGVSAATGSVVTVVSSRCDCASIASSSCLNAGGSATFVNASSGPATLNVSGGLDVTNCQYGVVAQTGTVAFAQTATFSGNSLTYSAQTANGGAVFLPNAITVTSGTADLSVDNGTVTSTYASLAGLYSCVSSLATGSKVCRL
jgi:hypothetical protein